MTKLAQRIDWWKVLKWLVLPVFIAVLYYQLTSLQQKPDLLNRLRVFLAEENIIIIVFVLPLLTFLIMHWKLLNGRYWSSLHKDDFIQRL